MTIIPSDLAIHKPKRALEKLLAQNELVEDVLFKAQSEFHTISVVQNKIGRFLKYDDTYQAGFIKTPSYSGNLPYINYFLIPALMKKDVKNILLVGFGSGILVNQFEKIFPQLKNIDVVDIEENIFSLAGDFFDFKMSDRVNFELQDALVYLKTHKKKYDLIIVDVAGDEGIDERFCDENYLSLIKKCLKKEGIFVSNMPSSRDIFNPKNKFARGLIELYKNRFKDVKLFNGETSNKIFYKTFFDVDEIVYDVTNLIFISSDKNYQIKNDNSLSGVVEIQPFLDDFIKI